MTAKQNLIKGRQRYLIVFVFSNLFCILLRARQIKLSKIASILEIETLVKNTINQPKILPATTYSQQHQLGKDLNLTIVRNCPAKY
jgi:hypothetical protein